MTKSMPFGNAERPLIEALRLGSLGLLIVTIVGALIGGPWLGTAVLWGWLLGSVIGGFFVLITVIIVLATARLTPSAMMVILLGSWIFKLLLVLAVISVIKNLSFYSKPAFALSVLVSLVIVLGAETIGILRTRVPYVEPESSTAEPESSTAEPEFSTAEPEFSTAKRELSSSDSAEGNPTEDGTLKPDSGA